MALLLILPVLLLGSLEAWSAQQAATLHERDAVALRVVRVGLRRCGTSQAPRPTSIGHLRPVVPVATTSLRTPVVPCMGHPPSAAG